MRLLALAIRYDHDDWATNFIPRWMTKLAAQVDHLDVLALEVGNIGDLPPNMRVFSMGKERGIGRLAVLAGFYRHAVPLIAQCDAVFVHMIPRYALLAAPIAIPLRKPMTLWYTHRNPSRDLKRAIPLVHRVTTAVESSFPIKTAKLRVLGHGIETDYFTPPNMGEEVPLPMGEGFRVRGNPDPKNTVVHVARLQHIKNQDKLIEALTHVPDLHAVIIGDVPQGEDQQYPQQLRQQVEQLNLSDQVTFTGGLTAEQVREWVQRAEVAVNLSPPGLFDKAALESMAAGVPTLVSNPAFDDVLGDWREVLRVPYPVDPVILGEKLAYLCDLSPAARTEMGQTLRSNVQTYHGFDTLITRLATVLKTGETD